MITWKLWASVPTVELWEAVALVVAIEPRCLEPSAHGWMAGPGRGPFFTPRSFPSEAKRADFDKALSFAERAANAAGPIYLRTGLAVGMNKRTAQVSLAEVVAYFIGCDWPDIPAPLLALLSAGVGSVAPKAQLSQAAAKLERENKRLEFCEAKGIIFDKASLSRLPDGVGAAARQLNIERQSLSTDLKAALERRFAALQGGNA